MNTYVAKSRGKSALRTEKANNRLNFILYHVFKMADNKNDFYFQSEGVMFNLVRLLVRTDWMTRVSCKALSKVKNVFHPILKIIKLLDKENLLHLQKICFLLGVQIFQRASSPL